MKRLRILVGLAALLWTASAVAGPREVVTKEPVYQGVTANAPIPAYMHILNEGGSDGAGLCVIASNVIDGTYQDVPELRDGKSSPVWLEAKKRPGGYYAEKLQKLFADVGMKTKWFQAESGDPEKLLAVIEYYNRQGIPVGITMNWGDKYGTNIHHMVSCIHLDAKLACIVDNNFPGDYFWVTRDELKRRIIDGPSGWIVALLWQKLETRLGNVFAAGVVTLGGLFLAVAAVGFYEAARAAGGRRP